MPVKKQAKRKNHQRRVQQPMMERAPELASSSPGFGTASESQLHSDASEPQPSAPFVDRLKSLFSSPTPNQPATVGESVASSNAPSTGSEAKPLPVETEAALAKVTDVIGETGETETGTPGQGIAVTPELTNRQHIDELIALGYVDEADIAEELEGLFATLGEYFDSDHWKLKPSQRDKMARPATAIVNSWIDLLMTKLPESFADRALDHPEYVALATAAAIPLVARGVKQLRISRSRKRGEEQPAPEPKQITAGSVSKPKRQDVKVGAFGIPESSGTFE